MVDSAETASLDVVRLAPIIGGLGIMLSLSLLVERILEVFSWLIDRLVAFRSILEGDPNKDLRDEMDEAVRAKAEDNLLRMTDEEDGVDLVEIPTNPEFGDADSARSTFDILPIDTTKGTTLKLLKEFWMQVFGVLVAVPICFHAKVSIFEIATKAGIEDIPSVAVAVPEKIGYMLTALMIASGSKPIHFLMRFLLDRKILVARQGKRNEQASRDTTSLSEPVPLTAPRPLPGPAVTVSRDLATEDFLGFGYDGGVRPDRLERTHLRSRPVDLIVFHHTAMHSSSPFEEVVREFDRKGWLTGYHCVVTRDGSVHSLCRWDRIGNHAYGVNPRSLGIALHGNFETDPLVPGANVGGTLGPAMPSMAQLHAGARAISLWCYLYGIDFDNEHVKAHKQVRATACPGSNFPIENFMNIIGAQHAEWKGNPSFNALLERFKQAPMVRAPMVA